MKKQKDPQDATLRNIRAANKKIAELKKAQQRYDTRLSAVEKSVVNLAGVLTRELGWTKLAHTPNQRLKKKRKAVKE